MENSVKELPGKTTFSLPPDHLVIIQTPGGGGWGHPGERQPDAAIEDRLDEKM
jgi:N-methylhydantoinase B